MQKEQQELANLIKGKKVAFIGAGVSHKTLIREFVELGAHVTLCDQKKSVEDFGKNFPQNACRFFFVETSNPQCGQYFSPTTSGTGPRQCGHISQCPAAYCARSAAVISSNRSSSKFT